MKINPLARKKNVKKEVLQRRYVYFGSVLAVVILLIGAGWGLRWLALRWELFRLQRMQVTGELKTLTTEQVLEWAQVKEGENLFSLDLDDIQQRLERHSIFKKILVHRRFPNALLIEVEELSPEFVLHTDRLYYVDDRGEIFKDITESEDKQDFPILSGVTEDMILNNPVQVRDWIREAVRLKAIYAASEFARQYGLSEIHFDEQIGFTLYPEKQKYSIKFGNANFEEKMQKLGDFWRQLEKSPVNLSSIDLNYPGKVLMTL
nr:POTRA domain, FtsQ-type [uncultured bacterium]